MEFNFTENRCDDCELEALSGNGIVLFDYIKFTENSIRKISDIMKNGIHRDNQELEAEEIVCEKSELKKFDKNKNYKMKCVALHNGDTGIIMNFGNVNISFEERNIKYRDEKVQIMDVEILAYPSGIYDFEIPEE